MVYQSNIVNVYQKQEIGQTEKLLWHSKKVEVTFCAELEGALIVFSTLRRSAMTLVRKIPDYELHDENRVGGTGKKPLRIIGKFLPNNTSRNRREKRWQVIAVQDSS